MERMERSDFVPGGIKISAQLAPAAARETDPDLDARAALLDQSYYRLLRLVNDLTAAGCLGQEEPPLPLRDRDLTETARSLCDSARGLAELLGLRLEFRSARQQQIWNYLLEITNNAYAAAGLMGNLYAESGLSPTNLQDACEASLGYEDGTYTEAVDSGTYSGFAFDGAGYGLAQWTWQERKQNLLAFAQDAGLSVGSLDLQLRFLAWELEERGLLPKLQAVCSVREASDLVLFRYEAPLDTSAKTQTVRCGLSMTFYNQFAGTLSQGQKDILEVTANPAAYGIPESEVGGLQWVKMVYETAGIWGTAWSATVTAPWKSPPWRAGLQHTKDMAGAGRVESPPDLGERIDYEKTTSFPFSGIDSGGDVSGLHSGSGGICQHCGGNLHPPAGTFFGGSWLCGHFRRPAGGI